MGNILILSPPLTITPAEMTQALEILDICMAEGDWYSRAKNPVSFSRL
jgi:4-aminobutyrate aminotransferase-like enzyme